MQTTYQITAAHIRNALQHQSTHNNADKIRNNSLDIRNNSLGIPLKNEEQVNEGITVVGTHISETKKVKANWSGH
jgi:hypothetical protein